MKREHCAQYKKIYLKEILKKFILIMGISIVGLFAIISLLQAVGIIPKRCDDLGPSEFRDENGMTVSVSPSGLHCYGIWHPSFWVKPDYL